MGFEAREVFNTVQLPAQELEPACPYNASLRQQDLYSVAGGFAVGYGPISGFVASGATASLLTRSAYLRPFMPIIVPMAGLMLVETSPIGMLIAPDGVIWENGAQAVYLDMIAGVNLDLGLAGGARAGYIASSGFYANYRHPKVGAVASTAVNRDFANLAYLLAGIQGFEPKDNAITGRTSLFGRKLQPNQGVLAAVDPSVSGAQNDVWSAHVEQLNIGHRFDIGAAARVAPETELQEAWFGFGSATDEEDMQSEFRVVAGVWNSPDMWFYGVEGGYKPTVYMRGSLGDGGFQTRFKVGLNDPEILAVYPWAVGSIFVNIGMSGGGGGD